MYLLTSRVVLFGEDDENFFIIVAFLSFSDGMKMFFPEKNMIIQCRLFIPKEEKKTAVYLLDIFVCSRLFIISFSITWKKRMWPSMIALFTNKVSK
jgi:hypothetical protein